MPLRERKLRTCPVCSKKVKKLAVHIRLQHGHSKADAQDTSRKLHVVETPTLSKSGRKRWRCGLQGCRMCVVHRLQHLKRAHRLEKGTALFKAAVLSFSVHRQGAPIEEDHGPESGESGDGRPQPPLPEPPEALQGTSGIQGSHVPEPRPSQGTSHVPQPEPSQGTSHVPQPEPSQGTSQGSSWLRGFDVPASEPSEGTSGIQARPCEFVPLRRADFEDSADRTCRQQFREPGSEPSQGTSQGASGMQGFREPGSEPSQGTSQWTSAMQGCHGPEPESSEGTSGIQYRPCVFVPLRPAEFEECEKLTSRKQCLDWYLQYQISISGGKKSRKNAQQHVGHVDKFWTFCENDHISVFCSYYINRFVLNVVSSDLAPGTVRSYLSSLTSFIKAAFNHRMLPEPTVERLTDCTTFIESCIKHIGKLCQERRVVMAEKAAAELLPEEARMFISNGVYVRKVARQFQSSPSGFYGRMRNALMLMLTITNGTRVSCLMEMTNEHVCKAHKSTIEGVEYMTIGVTKHKTAISTGAFKVVLTKDIYDMVLSLSRYVRVRFGPGLNNNVFRNIMGRPISSSSSANACRQTAWKDCGGLKKFGKINSDMNRKFYHVWRDSDSSAKLIHWLNAPENLKEKLSLPDAMQQDSPAEAETKASTSPVATARSPVSQEVLEPMTEQEHDQLCKRRHKFPGLTDDTTAADIRMAMSEVLAARPMTEYLEEAERWKCRSREMVLTTSLITINDCLGDRMLELGINLEEEMLGFFGFCGLSNNPQVQTNLMHILAVELARFFGCADDPYNVKSLPPREKPHSGPSPKPSVTVQQARKRYSADENRDFVDHFQPLIVLLQQGEEKLTLSLVRQYRGDYKPELTDQQIRDKLRNVLKQHQTE